MIETRIATRIAIVVALTAYMATLGALNLEAQDTAERQPATTFAESESEQAIASQAAGEDAPQPAGEGEEQAASDAAAGEEQAEPAAAGEGAESDSEPALREAADEVESLAADDEVSESVLIGEMPALEATELPAAGQFEPDESLLIEAPSYVPSYDEIVSQSEQVVQDYAEPGLEMRQNVRLRKARTQALSEPEIQAARENALQQRFFPEQQQAWKEYYDLLFDRIAELEPDLDEAISERKNAELRRLGLPLLAVENEAAADEE